MKIKTVLGIVICYLAAGFNLSAQYNEPGNGNPIVPGYFADPTVKKFGDTWYLYATTDAIEQASGAPQVWVSKDFKNWVNYKIELPNLRSLDVWAPEVVEGPDGRYYYFFSSCRSDFGGCSIFGYVSDTPIGPWESLTANGEPVIPSNFNPPIIPLDPNILKDDDGSYYIYYCTWAVYDGHGVGWAKMNSDMKSFSDKGIIPNTQLPDVFEAPFMIKKDDVYYLSYSAGSTHDGSYKVKYATSDSPTGTFSVGANNPITQSTTDRTIDAPGHHSFFQEGDDYYIAYHRHTNPNGLGGLVRQVCVDPVTFGAGVIEKVNLTHTGVGALATNQIPLTDLAFGSIVTASSYYTDDVNNYDYSPENAVDDNNGTIWKAGSTDMGEWLQIDLGTSQNIKWVLTDFEFPIYYYQYKIEYSTDAQNWLTYADKTQNKRGGSPMLDAGDVTGRYLKVTITGVQKPGLFPAIWNIKVYNDTSEFSVLENPEQAEGPSIVSRGNKLLDIKAAALSTGEKVNKLTNQGTLGGTFTAKGEILVEDVDGRRGFSFGGSDYLEFSKRNPESQTWNAPYTVSAWVYNPKVGGSECILTWANRGGPMGTYAGMYYGTNGSWGAAAHWDYHDMGFTTVPEEGKWHHITLSFDGGVERVFVDGVLNAKEQKNLYVNSNGKILVGFSGEAVEYFTGTLASLEMYDYALSKPEIDELYAETGCKPETLFPQFQLEEGSLLETQKVGVNPGTKVKLHPSFSGDETDAGNWSWAGVNGFTSDTRDVVLSSLTDAEFGEYTVSYTNSCDITSSQTFIVQKAQASLPDTYITCSSDTEPCSYFGRVNIAYGTAGNYFYVYNMDGKFDCGSSFFGDPAPDATDKQCYIEELNPFDGNIAVFAEVSTSYVSPWETLSAVNDGNIPESSEDKTNGQYGNWSNPNSFQWVQYNWEQEYYITLTDIYWFTDNGGLLIPVEAYVEYYDGSTWIKWGDIGVEKNKFNTLNSEVVHTNALRITFKNDTQSTGILEWRVYGTLKDPTAIGKVNIEGGQDLVRIFPNPTNSKFTIEPILSNQGKVMEVSIYNFLGSKVYHSFCNGDDKLILDRSTLGSANSLYFVKVAMNGKVSTSKLVVK